MDPTPLMTQTATITPQAGTDAYGDPLPAGTPFDVACWLFQTRRDEKRTIVGEDMQAETWTLYLPPGTTVDGNDNVAVDGVTYEVVGPPWPAFNPRSRKVTHIEATLRRAA